MLYVMYYSVLAVNYISYMMYYHHVNICTLYNLLHCTIHLTYFSNFSLSVSVSVSVSPKLEEFTRKERQGVFYKTSWLK